MDKSKTQRQIKSYDAEYIKELKLKLYEVQLKIRGYEKEIRLYFPNDFRRKGCMRKLLTLKSIEYELADEIQMQKKVAFEEEAKETIIKKASKKPMI